MKLKELKDWLNTIPDTFNDYEVVNGEYGILNENDDEYHYRVDKPVIASVVDEETKEVVLLHEFNDKGYV